ncbi:MAG: MATE family efflux transporter [Pusillimonas sp.]|nr:MATE family efflux transporter [Pusillimonas sp.]
MNTNTGAHSLFFYIGETLRQAWPVLISAWAGIAFGVLDTTMVGHASAADLQAMALSVSIYLTVFIGLMGVVHALIPIIGQHFGARQPTRVGHAWGQGVWLSFGLACVGSIALVFPDVWLMFSGTIEPEVRHGVTWYLRMLVVALPASLLFRTIYCLGTAVSRPKIVMTINLVSVGFKALFNWIFIFGKFGAPALGAVGAGLSSAIVAWMTLLIGLWVITHDPFFKPFQLRLGHPDWPELKSLLRLGLPMGGSYLVEVCAFTFMALLVAREGMFVTGGHQIMANLAALCYMLPMAIGIASASLTAQAIGAQAPQRALLTGRAGFAVVIMGATLTVGIIIVFRNSIVAAYTDDTEVAAVALTLLTILPLFLLCDAMQCIMTYLLRAYKVAVVPLAMQVMALSVFGLGGGWLLGFGPWKGALEPLLNIIMPGAPAGAGSLWFMAALGLGLSAILLKFWYRRIVRQYQNQFQH